MFKLHRYRPHLPAAALAAVIALAAAQAPAAGDHDGGHGHAADIGEPGDPAQVSRTVEVVMTDNAYDLESIAVEEGETVRFVVRNEGKFVHEFGIGTPAMHAAHREEMMTMMEDGVLEADRINRGMMNGGANGANGHEDAHDDPNSVLLEPGEQAEIVWTFATEAELEFACNVPGHYESGMKGEFRIRHGGS